MFKFIQSIVTTPVGKRYHYKTLINGKAHSYETITDEKGNILRHIPWINGLKQGMEYTYNESGDIETCCPYFEGFRYGQEILYDNGIIKEIINWEKGQKLSYEIYNKFGTLERYIELINKTGYEYYPDGQIKCIFTFDGHEFERKLEEWYNEDGSLMSKKQVDAFKKKKKYKKLIF